MELGQWLLIAVNTVAIVIGILFWVILLRKDPSKYFQVRVSEIPGTIAVVIGSLSLCIGVGMTLGIATTEEESFNLVDAAILILSFLLTVLCYGFAYYLERTGKKKA